MPGCDAQGRDILSRIIYGARISIFIGLAVIVISTIRMANVIILEASLSFLGLGVQPPTASWGGMVSDGRAFILEAWWVSTFPGLAILLLVQAADGVSLQVRRGWRWPTRRFRCAITGWAGCVIS